MLKSWLHVLILLELIISGCNQNKTKMADLVILNGNIITMNDSLPEAEALAVLDGKIWKVGNVSEIELLIGKHTEVIRLEGQMVIPGFIDAHGHLENLGKFKREINLFDAKTYAEIIKLVENKVQNAKAGEWIIGRGWHQEKWDTMPALTFNGYPIHDALSAISPNNPVILKHASGHAILANALAMELSGISDGTPDPSDGTIVRNSNGMATGIFEENAADIITERMNADFELAGEEEVYQNWKASIQAAMAECLSKGITSFHDAGVELKKISRFERLKKEGLISVRLNLMIFDKIEDLEKAIEKFPVLDTADHLLNIRSIKQYVDGALGTRTAWLLEEYTDDPGNFGDMVTSISDLNKLADLANSNGMQLCLHAIGDRGVREVLDVYSQFIDENKNTLRWRIEHAQHVHPDDIAQFAKYNIIASMQPNHCTSDAPYVLKRLGEERAKMESYIWKSMTNNNIRLALGTDTPIEDVSPILNFHSAVTRKLKSGDLFYPEQCMSRLEALRYYTLGNAYAGFTEDFVGSLTEGKLADIVILSDNILEIPADQIPKTQVLYTLVNGKIVFQR